MSKTIKFTRKIKKPEAGTKVDRYQNQELRKVKRQLRQLSSRFEKKFYDYHVTSQIGSAGRRDYLTNISEGDNPENREGEVINIASVHVNGFINFDASATVPSQVRVMLVEDREPDFNQGIVSTTDLLNAVLATTTTSGDNVNFYRNLTNRYRFRVLSDKHIQLDQYHPQARFDFNHVLKNKKLTLKFNSPNNLPSSGTTYYLLTMSDEGNVLYQPEMSMNARIRYYDA